MFDHVEYKVRSLAASGPIYVAIFKALGAEVLFYDSDAGEAGFGQGDVTFMLLTEGAATTPPMHICLSAPNTAAVDTAFAAALAAGATDNGAPGLRVDYAPNYYAAFIHDPDGHNIEVLHRIAV